MATAGDGGANTAYAYERGGGAGGKLRKRPFRRTTQTTPYDRPPTTLHNSSNTSGNSDGSWFSKLVLDPASKLLSTSAHYFFRERLPPPSSSIPPPEATQEQSNGLQVEVPVKHDGEVSAVVEDGNHTNSSNDIGISKLEQMLRQKTFTRSEVDRLSELLRSRIFDLPVVDSDCSEANLSEQVSELGKPQGVANGLAKENKAVSEGFNGIISTPVVSSRVLEEDVATPVELAKAYMGRPSKVSPSVLRFRSQVLREDVDMINKIQFSPGSATRSLAPKISTGLSFTNPRSRGRYAIYSMARMPCSKIHPVTTQQDAGFTNDVSGGSQLLSSSNHAWGHGRKFVSKQVRRSSVIDDEIGSLRRVRQKTNILSQGNPLSICQAEVGFNSQQRSLSSTKRPIIIREPVNKVSKIVGENEGKNIPSTDYPSVPFKSSEMATKILQYIEKLTPKEKSSESKLLSARDKLPLKLMPEMLCVSTLKSVEDMDSPKLFQNSEDSHMLKGVQNALSPDIHDSISEKRGKVEENGIRKFSVSPNMSIPVKNGDTTISAEDVISSSRTVDAVTKDLVAQPVQKKWAFQISAPEHSLELDGDIHSNGPASSPAAELKEKPEASVVEKEVVSKEATKVKTKSKTHADPVLNKIADFEPFDGSVVGVKNNGFTTSTSIFNASSQQTVLSQLTPENIRSAEAKEANSRLFSFSSKVGDKVPQNAYSSMSHINEPSGPKYNATLNLSPESSNSFATVQLKVPEPEKVENKNADKFGGTIGTLKDPFVAGLTSAISSASSFDGLSNNSNSHNGSLASSPIAVTVPASINTMNQIFGSGSHVASSTRPSLNLASTTTMASSSISTVAPSFTTSPISKFGSSMSSSSLSVAPTTLTTEPLEIISRSEKEGTIGNLSRSVFGSTSFTTTTGGSIFGLSSSGTSTINSQFQGSLISTGNRLVSTQFSPYGSGATAVSQSMPIQFGSPASSAVFGTPAITSSSNSLFASSTPAKRFGSGSSFGLNSSAYSSETEYASSSSGAMPSMFNFGTSSSSFSSGTNFVSSSAVTTPSIFNFGVSSFASSAAPNFINSNTAAAPNAFASSSVSASVSGSSTANPSTVATPSVFTFGGSSLASSSGTNSISSASGATSSVFSSCWQPNLIGSAISSISPTVFSFGASSSSSAATRSPIFGASTSSFLSSTSASTRSLASQSQPIFGNSTSVFAAPSDNGDQINMEDSMAEDSVHATAAFPVFGQPPSRTDFTFGSTAPLSATPFQFVGQQNQTAPQNFSAFQASANLEFNAGGNFSLGSHGGGGDKSNRKFVKVSRNRNRRK